MSRSSVTTEIEHQYEDRARAKLPGILYTVCGLVVIEPDLGFNRTFYRREWGNEWPDEIVGDTVECDFWGHTSDIKSISIIHPSPNRRVFVTQSHTTDPDESTHTVRNGKITPDRALGLNLTESPLLTSCSKYVVAEITHGGMHAILSKIEQLEKDCLLCLAKSKSTILDTVAVAIVICTSKDSYGVLNFIRSNRPKFPNIYTLMTAGRFLHIKFGETTTALVEDMAVEIESLRNDLLELREDMKVEMSVLIDEKLEDFKQDLLLQIGMMMEKSNTNNNSNNRNKISRIDNNSV